MDIQPPDMETRVAILKMKAAHEKFMLSDEVAEFIAENATTNIRDMEGLLNKIIFFSSLANRVIDSKEQRFHRRKEGDPRRGGRHLHRVQIFQHHDHGHFLKKED